MRLLLLGVLPLAACMTGATDRGATVVFASGADLQSPDPLVTTHPLAKQVQRYVLLTTLVQYDSALRVRPYLAREWRWSADSTLLTLHLFEGLRWDDGVATTARDAAWTLRMARDPATGYPRLSDLYQVSEVIAPDDATLAIRFDRAQAGIPDVLTDLAILPAHLLDSVPAGRLRGAAWEANPIGNGPFRFVSHEPNRRWVFEARPSYPEALGGPARIRRLVIAVVDEPTTKLAALTAGELDFAGIQPAHAAFVRRDPRLEVVSYPLLFTYMVVFNTRRPPFDDLATRRAFSDAVNRRQIVDGYLFGFGTPATTPLPAAPDAWLERQQKPPAPTATPAPAPPPRHQPPLAFELLTVGSGEAALEQMLQAQVAPAGFDARIRQLELTSFLDRVQGPVHEFQAAVMGISGDPGMGYLRRVLQLAGMSGDGSVPELLRRFRDSVPVAFLYHARGVQGVNRRIQGVRMDLRGELAGIREWWVSPGSRRSSPGQKR